MPRPTRHAVDQNAAAYRAALLGEPCPEGFNQFTYLDIDDAARGHVNAHTDGLRDLWKAERTALLREWKRRRRAGQPPGAYFDSGRVKNAHR